MKKMKKARDDCVNPTENTSMLLTIQKLGLVPSHLLAVSDRKPIQYQFYE